MYPAPALRGRPPLRRFAGAAKELQKAAQRRPSGVGLHCDAKMSRASCTQITSPAPALRGRPPLRQPAAHAVRLGFPHRPAPALRGRPPLRPDPAGSGDRGDHGPAPALRGRPPLRPELLDKDGGAGGPPSAGPPGSASIATSGRRHAAAVCAARQRRPSGVGLHCDWKPWLESSSADHFQRRPSGVGLHCDAGLVDTPELRRLPAPALRGRPPLRQLRRPWLAVGAEPG